MHYPTPISPKTHGFIDYATSSAVALAPTILDMPKREAAFTYGLAAGMAGLTALSRTPVSAKGVVPLKAHAATDAVLGMALPFVPRLLDLNGKGKDDKNARFFFCGLAGLVGTVALMTDWNGRQRRGKTTGRARKTSRRRTSKTASA
jgi:hypothetical protein